MPIAEIRISSKLEPNITHIYRFEGISDEEAVKLSQLALTDPITQTSVVNDTSTSAGIEIGYKPGVTDPISDSLMSACALLGIKPTAVSSSREFQNGQATPSQIEMVIKEKPDTLLFAADSRPVEIINLSALTCDQLERLSETRSLFLNLEEMLTIQSYYRKINREPSDIELETFAQTWSEHCAHKTFKAILHDKYGRVKEPLMTRLKRTSQKFFDRVGVVTAFSDNSGGILFYDGFVIIGKGETHNSPVAIEPDAGARTKVGGLFRDINGTGRGARNLATFVINNFAYPYNIAKLGSLDPKHLLLENSRGEREYGNPMGIPTHGVSLHFHPDFGPKPTSLGVAIGMTREQYSHKGEPEVGDLIVTVGGSTGRDGIHGATFSSAEMTTQTLETHGTAVQLGDPIIEQAMFEALLKTPHLIRAITDCGAGGYASAIGEMADGIGAEVFLDDIPLKYSGLSSWEKWLSESQERMVVAVPPEHWNEFARICALYDTKAAIIGKFSGHNKLEIFEQNEKVADIDLNFLHHGLPQRHMLIEPREPTLDSRKPSLLESVKQQVLNVFEVLANLNICSKEDMHRQYDQTVQAMTVLAPYTGKFQDAANDGVVLAPFHDRSYGVAISHALNPILNRIDPYKGSVWAFAHAASKFAAIGGDISSAAGIDNFIWPVPDPQSLADLDRSMDALCDTMEALRLPMVSGKDSLSSTYRGPDGEVIKVPPSLNITLFGKIPDIEKTVSCDFKSPHSCICLIGQPDIDSMGGSVYFQTQGIVGDKVPQVDLKVLPKTLHALHQAIELGQIKSAKAIGEGGLITALAQMCFGGDCGAWIETAELKADRVDNAIFNETAGCILIEVENANVALEAFSGVPLAIIGFTTPEKSIRIHRYEMAFDPIDVDELKQVWKKPMRELLT